MPLAPVLPHKVYNIDAHDATFCTAMSDPNVGQTDGYTTVSHASAS